MPITKKTILFSLFFIKKTFINISYKMCLSKFLGHSREPYGHPHCFLLVVAQKTHLIQKMCFVTLMCTHCPHE